MISAPMLAPTAAPNAPAKFSSGEKFSCCASPIDGQRTTAVTAPTMALPMTIAADLILANMTLDAAVELRSNRIIIGRAIV